MRGNGAATGAPRDDLRSRVRPLVPRRAYRAGHGLLNAAAALRRLPLREATRLLLPHDDPGALLELHPRNLLHPFLLPGDRAARRSFVDVVLRELYGVQPPREPPGVIVDGGAHVGDSTAWLLTRYPSARVVAVEPAADSHRLLVRNAAPYGERAVPVRAALWGETGRVTLTDPGASTGVRATDAHRVGERVRALTPSELLDELGLARIDLLKLDVEGAERSLFSAPSADDWLERTGSVLIEIHGDEAEAAVLPALHRHGFSVSRYRELHVATR